jgi:hypothetical protein
MALQDLELFSPYSSQLGSLAIPDTLSTDPQAGVNQILQSAAGSLDVLAQGVSSVDSRFSITCVDLRHLSSVSILNGLRPTGDSRVQYQLRASGGAFATSGHVTFVFSKCHVIPDSIQAQQDQNTAAALQLMVYPLWDGTNLPVRIIGQSLSGTPAIGAFYRLGPSLANGTYLGGVQSASVQFGLDYKTKRQGGEFFAREGAVYQRRPTINVETLNFSILPVGFSQVHNVNFTQFFRRDGFAPNDAVHFSVSGNGTLRANNIATQQDDDARPGLTFTPTGQLTISQTATIPSPV